MCPYVVAVDAGRLRNECAYLTSLGGMNLCVLYVWSLVLPSKKPSEITAKLCLVGLKADNILLGGP